MQFSPVRPPPFPFRRHRDDDTGAVVTSSTRRRHVIVVLSVVEVKRNGQGVASWFHCIEEKGGGGLLAYCIMVSFVKRK